MTNDPPVKVDYLEAGSSGPFVILVHSSVAGARQWRRLMEDLKGRFRVRAVNLFGYSETKRVSSKPRCRKTRTRCISSVTRSAGRLP